MYFLGQLQRAWEGPDPSALDGLWDNECGSCRDYAQTAQYYQEHGQAYVGSILQVRSAKVIEQAQGFTVVQVVGTVPSARVVDKSGKVVTVIANEDALIEYTLWFRGTWQVTRVTVRNAKK